jgi:cobaltochelatase CobN
VTILVLTTADTEILALRSIIEDLPPGFPLIRAANPVLLLESPDLDGVECVLVRLLGGRSAWPDGFDRLRAECVDSGIPVLAFGGEDSPDADLAARSTVPSATLAAAFEYWRHGGLANIEHLLRFVADTVLLGGWGFDPPEDIAPDGVWGGSVRLAAVSQARQRGIAVIGVVFYRAHVVSGNTGFVDDLVAAIEDRGAVALPVWCYSLRTGDAAALLEGCDAVVTTVLAAGATDGDDWDPGALGALGVPVLQAVCATSTAFEWSSSAAGLSPIDVAMSVAIPEFDGRIPTVLISTKEVVDDGDTLGWPVTAYRTLPDRVRRVAGIAVRMAALRRIPVADRRVAIMLSAYPTRRSRIGNAVALDTPASVIALLHALRGAGYRVDRIPADGDTLMAELADGLTYDRDALSPAQLATCAGRWPAADYERWFATVPLEARQKVEASWGPAPGTVHVDGGDLCFAGIDLGGVLIAVQPPRGFGEDPIAVYHSPDLPPTHHYLAFYRWLDLAWGAHAVVHAGKHGTLEWLPGKGVGLSNECFPDLALGDLPLAYPFVVNDPGEGTQAKRRAHAVIVDHLLPPMTRAETYDELAQLESLLDEHARVAALDPAKLPAIRAQVWELLVAASLHRDLGIESRPADDDFDDTILHIDGYLCELKDAQIRGGLHILGQPPHGDAEVDLVLAMTRLPQGDVPALRVTAVGATRAEVDDAEGECRRRVVELQAAGWPRGSADPTLAWVSDRLVPALHRAPDEIGAVLSFLEGGSVPPGPSGAPTRGMAHVLPTGRNFYSVDPKAVPSRLAWEVGVKLADAVCRRHIEEEGALPETVGIVMWGTAAMRTAGDDVAEALALLGVRPRWAAESARVVGLEPIPLDELGRPRIDVTVRISGFFRDAFPHLVFLLEDAVALVGSLDEPVSLNFVRAHGADPRVFGAKPGGYGSGMLPLLESRDWRTDEDLAAVYTAWSGWSYGRAGMGVAAPEAMRRRFTAIDVAIKNQDNREHDIFDSDDYLQDHGGMIATIRALRAEAGLNPAKAWFGDSADPARPRVRSLAEEAARVVRTRVINPKWIASMQRHGYKGAFEMAATVDYLFGYDATAHVVEDWMYERVTESYVGDAAVRKFFEQSNPWALRGIVERLLEAVDRGLWSAPSTDAIATLRDAVLEAEGWEEGR